MRARWEIRVRAGRLWRLRQAAVFGLHARMGFAPMATTDEIAAAACAVREAGASMPGRRRGAAGLEQEGSRRHPREVTVERALPHRRPWQASPGTA